MLIIALKLLVWLRWAKRNEAEKMPDAVPADMGAERKSQREAEEMVPDAQNEPQRDAGVLDPTTARHSPRSGPTA